MWQATPSRNCVGLSERRASSHKGKAARHLWSKAYARSVHTRRTFVIVTHRKAIEAVVCMTLLTAGAGKAQWVAYNDNVPGSATHPNATTNNIRLQMSGALKDVVTGTNLPVTLAITHSSSGIVYSAFGQNPLPNTALYNSFNGFVVFGPVSGATDANVELTNGALSTV